MYKLLVAYVDRRLQTLGSLRRSPFTSLWWQMEPFTSLWWIAWFAVCKPSVADGVFYKPLVAYVDRPSQAFGGRWSHLQAFSGIRGSSYTRLLVAYVDRRVEAFGGIHWLSLAKPLVADVDRHSQAFGSRWNRLQTFGGIRGSSYLWWHTWIVLCNKPLGAYVDRRSQAFGGIWSPLEAFGGIHGSTFTSHWLLIQKFTSHW